MNIPHTPARMSTPDNSSSCFCTPFVLKLPRVLIKLTNEKKHALPVEEECRYARPSGIVREQTACKPLEGAPEPESYKDLAQCTRESECRIVDDHLQMSVMRDPRYTFVGVL